MKKIIIIAVSVLSFSTVSMAGWVNGYYKSNGTYVQGHHRSDPNSTVNDNWSTKGNVNPHTNKKGTKPRKWY